MADPGLKGCRILVAEDEYLLAEELSEELRDSGAVVLGPAPTVTRAFALVEQQPELDGAVLDVNLGGEPVYPVADMLIERGVPVVFTTGYDRATLPERFASVTKCEKPISLSQIAAAISRAIRA